MYKSVFTNIFLLMTTGYGSLNSPQEIGYLIKCFWILIIFFLIIFVGFWELGRYITRLRRQLKQVLKSRDVEIEKKKYIQETLNKTIENLKASEDKFQTICNSAKDAIIMMDPKGCVSFWNKAAEDILGWTENEIRGLSLHETLSPLKYREIQDKGFRLFQQTGEGPAIGKTLELSAIRKDSNRIPH